MTNFPQRFCVLFGLCALAACAGNSPGHGDNYHPSNDSLNEVRSTLERAGVENRLGLIILGANWCHDSRALAARLNESPLKELISQQYVTTLVDVGYYERGQAVMRQLGQEMYYATPTVLIVDPQTGQVINNHDRLQWGAAESVSMKDSVEYFLHFSQRENLPESLGSEVLAALTAVQQFEAAQAKRVALGYEVVGPMLAVLDQTKVKPNGFDARWRELAGFRNGLARDISELRQAVINGGSPDQGIREIESKYPKHSWEL